LKSANRLNQNKETTTTQKATTRKSPQPDLRFASGKSEAKSTKTPRHKNGARAQTKTPTESICTRKQWKIHCIPIKSMQYELNVAAAQADIKTQLGG